MARLPYLDKDDLTDEDKEIVKRPINLNRVIAHSPEAARKFSDIGNYIRFGSSLDPRLREMAILQVGYLTKNAYEYSHAVWMEHLSEAHIVDLVMVIAFYNGVVRLLGALEIDVEPEYSVELEKHPLPKK